MSSGQIVWIDLEQCTGCAACAELCHLAAVSMTNGRAHVDEKTCDGCQACIDACPERAIHPLVHGEIVKVEELTPLTVRPRGTLVETAGAAATIAGVSLLPRVAAWLARRVGAWLTEGPSWARRPLKASGLYSVLAGDERAVHRGRRARHRRRGA